jgi:hypothetical protein
MAEISGDQASGAVAAVAKAAQKPHPFTPSSREASTAKGPTVSFKREEFSTRIAGQPNVSRDGKHVEEGVSPPEEVTFSKETIDGLRGFASGYTQRLLDLQSGGSEAAAIYRAIEADQGGIYGVDRVMLDTFAPRDPKTGERKLLDGSKINENLTANPQIMESVSIAMERYISDCLAAVHLRVRMEIPGNRTNVDRLARTIHLPMDRGSVNDAAHRLTRWLGEPYQHVGRDTGHTNVLMAGGTVGVGGTVGAIGGGVLAGPVGLGLGAEIGGIAAGIAGATFVGRVFRPGIGVRFVEDQAIGVLPAEQARAQYFLKINPNNPLQSTDIGNRMQEVYQLLYTRTQYMRAIGVDGQNLDALSEQWIYNEGQRAEETGDKMRIRVQEQYEPARTQYLAEHHLAPGTVLTLAQQREVYRQAQRDVLLRTFQEARAARGRAAMAESLESSITRIEAAITGRGENGEIVQARTREATAERGRFETDRTANGETEGNLTRYQAKLREVEAARIEFAREAGRITVPAGLDVMLALRRARDEVSAPRAPVPVVELPDGATRTQIDNPRGELARIQQEINRDIANIRPQQRGEDFEAYRSRRRGEEEDIRTQHQSRIDELNRQRQLITDAMTHLQELQNTINTKVQEATPSTSESSADANAGTTSLREIQDAYERIVAMLTPAVGPAAPLNLDFNPLMQDINGYGGWPENENNLPENRLLVHRAIIRQRTINQMHDAAIIPNFAVLEAAFENFTNNPVAGLRISPEQLRAMSVDQLVQLALDRGWAPGAGGAAPVWRPELENAKRWADQILERTLVAAQEEDRIIDTAITEQDRRIRNEDTELQTAQLTMIKNILNDADKLPERANVAISDDVHRRNLIDIRPVTVAANQGEGYTAAEEASRLPRNVLEVIDILTGYQNPATGDRNGAFDRIWRNINANPAIFLRMLNRSFEGQLTAAPDIDTFARRLRTALRTTHTVNEGNFGYFITPMRRELVNWANSI